MSVLRKLLKPIPQDPRWHPEGDVHTHTYMVRHSLDRAIDAIQTANLDCFSYFKLSLNFREKNILRAAAWLHDIGKAGTTTLNVGGYHIKYSKSLYGGLALASYIRLGRWQAIGHEWPKYFKPQLRNLQNTAWKKVWDAASLSDRRDLLFIIKHHMALRGFSFSKGGFGRKLSAKLIASDGRYKDKRRIKLLLILIIMDRMGRGGINPAAEAVQAMQVMQTSAIHHQRRYRPQSLPSPNDPIEFIKALSGKPERVIKLAFRGKFNRDVEPVEFALAAKGESE